jgi:hypothetical protein
VKDLLLCLVTLICSGCVHRSTARPPVQPTSAFATEVSYLGQSGIGLGCLPHARDSTRFEVNVIVDSLREKNVTSLWLIRRERSAPRPGYNNQAVTVEVRRAGQTRFVGTSCWQDAGVVVRGQTIVLAEAEVYLDAPGTILVRVFDGGGTVLVDSAHVGERSRSDRISWMPPPPNER